MAYEYRMQIPNTLFARATLSAPVEQRRQPVQQSEPADPQAPQPRTRRVARNLLQAATL